ncbi:MAG: hypothetical protein HY809_10915 [Nitrospirae bacterium]|nr:hypothetical protein [Nitrospirota bacterium]
MKYNRWSYCLKMVVLLVAISLVPGSVLAGDMGFRLNGVDLYTPKKASADTKVDGIIYAQNNIPSAQNFVSSSARSDEVTDEKGIWSNPWTYVIGAVFIGGLAYLISRDNHNAPDNTGSSGSD